jgi:hypothetical protein
MLGSSRRALGAYRRTALVGLASAGLLVWGLGPAGGQPTATAATAATPEAAPFSNGMAKATAIVTKVAPGVGSLELALANGIAVAELKNHLTQAQAQSLDLGLIGTTLTAEGCRDAALTADELPQPTRVDNRKGNAAATSDEVPLADSTLGGGRESARATATLASAVATSAASVAPVLTVDGGQAEATTEVVDGAARQAHASVRVNLDIAGAVELGGLHWDALHRTGADPVAVASFDVGSAKLLGVPLPLDSLTTLETTLNTALAATGISLTFPRVERFEEPTDLVRITPLRIVLKDSPAGKAGLGPVLDLTRQQRFDLFNQLSDAICDAAGILLVGDIGMSIASGTGFLAIEVGGAEAISGDLVVEDPFGPPVAPPAGPSLPPVLSDPVVPGVPTVGPVAPPAAGPVSPPAQRVVDVGPLEEHCETIHPFRAPSCSGGALLPLGLIGLVATVGVGGLDWQHQRRRRSGLAPDPTPAGAA